MENNDPSTKTMKAINNVMRDRLGGHVVNQHEVYNGLIEFWYIKGKIIIVHAYRGDNGWTHYLESKAITTDQTVLELC